mgnify:CR=1 FL=1
MTPAHADEPAHVLSRMTQPEPARSKVAGSGDYDALLLHSVAVGPAPRTRWIGKNRCAFRSLAVFRA